MNGICEPRAPGTNPQDALTDAISGLVRLEPAYDARASRRGLEGLGTSGPIIRRALLYFLKIG